jgi:hypothetical protein
VTSFGPKPNAQGLRSGISPVAEETAQTIMSHGLPPAQGWRKQQTPQGNFWRFDDWSDLFANLPRERGGVMIGKNMIFHSNCRGIWVGNVNSYTYVLS